MGGECVTASVRAVVGRACVLADQLELDTDGCALVDGYPVVVTVNGGGFR
jgi:hypothetical protein